MKLHLMSDLHLEFAPMQQLPGGDVLLLAGDILVADSLTASYERSEYSKFFNHVQQNIGIFINVMPGARILRIVTMMLIEPMIDEAPIK